MRTILHVSDLHFGRTDPVTIEQLLRACTQLEPQLVVISGDLTQRAHVSEFERARAFIDALRAAGRIVFVIPGNHDIRPLHHPIARAITPYDRYREYISAELEPQYCDEELAVAAIDTVRRGKISNGAIGLQQVERARRWFATLDRQVTRIIVTHHPLDLPARPRILTLAGRAKKAIYTLGPSRVDVYLSGHYHRSSVVSTQERYHRLTAPSIAVQAGTVSLRERGEAQSFNLLKIDGSELLIETHSLRADKTGFEISAVHRFIRERGIWHVVPAPHAAHEAVRA